MRFLFSFFIFLLLFINGVRANEGSNPDNNNNNNNNNNDNNNKDNNNNNNNNNNNKYNNPDPFHLFHNYFPSHHSDLLSSLSNDFQSLRLSIAAIDEKIQSHKKLLENQFQAINNNNPLVEQFSNNNNNNINNNNINNNNINNNNNNNNNNKPSIPINNGDSSSFVASNYLSERNQLLSPSSSLSLSTPTTITSISLSKIDLIEKSNHYLINAELAGISKDNISIIIDNGLIIIEGKKEQKKEENNEGGKGGEGEEKKINKYHYTERSYSSIKRSLRIPSDVDISMINAYYQNGLLSITLPKKNNQDIKTPTKIMIQ